MQRMNEGIERGYVHSAWQALACCVGKVVGRETPQVLASDVVKSTNVSGKAVTGQQVLRENVGAFLYTNSGH